MEWTQNARQIIGLKHKLFFRPRSVDPGMEVYYVNFFVVLKVDVLCFMCYPAERKKRSVRRGMQSMNARQQIAALLEEAG